MRNVSAAIASTGTNLTGRSTLAISANDRIFSCRRQCVFAHSSDEMISSHTKVVWGHA